jgi:diacylglycerol kinase (ATP)
MPSSDRAGGPSSAAPGLVLLGNPKARCGRGEPAIVATLDALRRRGATPDDVLRTKAPGHATELARAAARSGCALLVLAGGDGTVREALCGLLGAAEEGHALPAVGLVPAGTCNDLARALGVPRDVPRAVGVALGESERAVDVWHFGETAFVTVAGVGFDAAVARAAKTRFRRLRGTAGYVAALLSELPRRRPIPLRLSWPNGELICDAWMVALGNTASYGGGMRVAPRAVPDDGRLEVVVVGALSRAGLLAAFPRVFSGGHVSHPRITVIEAEEVVIEGVGGEALLDGDVVASESVVRVTRAPWAVRVRCPTPAS